MSPQRRESDSVVLSGQDLRYQLTTLLAETPGRSYSTAELAAWVLHNGFVLPGRPGKIVADALRWEILRGRVHRVRRGVYRTGAMPRSTHHYLRQRAARRRTASYETRTGLSQRRASSIDMPLRSA